MEWCTGCSSWVGILCPVLLGPIRLFYKLVYRLLVRFYIMVHVYSVVCGITARMYWCTILILWTLFSDFCFVAGLRHFFYL